MDCGVEYRIVHGAASYRVGSDGSLWSSLMSSGRADNSWKQIRGSKNAKGYLCTTIVCDDGVRRRAYLHRLVLSAFFGNASNGMECCHNNGKRDDNRLSNLRWGTTLDNARDRKCHGTERLGESHPSHKLTERDVREIRQRVTRGERVCVVARDYSVRYDAVWQAATRRSWRHI